jgi:trans-aconitate methyltransferase
VSGATQSVNWQARFQAERTPWERPTLNAAFLTWRRDGVLAPCRILVPGAGRSGEPLALRQDGFDVTVVDSAPLAVAVQLVRFHAAALAAKIHEADLMTWSPPAPFDAIYDQTCLCALPPAIWPAYAARLQSWLRPGGRLFLLAMQTGATGGPPYDCSVETMRALFGAGWIWPDSLPPLVPHRLGQGEIPIVLQRGSVTVA